MHELEEETGEWNDNERKGPNVPNNRLSHLTEKIKKEKQKEYKNPRPAFDVTSRRCKAKNQVRPIIYTNFLLRCLIDSIAVCVRDSPAITSITIDGIPLTLKYLNILCSGLKTNEKLMCLSLKKCYIGDVGCDLLLNCLKNNPKLSVLNLSSCKLSSRSAMSLSLFLKRRKADLLQNIWEQSSEENTEKLQGLHTLILNQNPKIEDTGLKQLIYALKNDVWLKTLSLKRCGISKLGAEMMIRLLQSNNRIVRLDLTKNHIPINTLQIMLSILKKRQEMSEKGVLNKQFCLNWRKNIKNEIIKFTKRHRKYSQNRIERPRKSSLQKHYWKKTQRFERFIQEKQVKGITKEDYYRRKKINDLELQLLNLIESNSKLKEELSSNKALLNSEVQQRSKIENELQRISFRLNDLKSKVFMLNCISSKACNESQLLTGFKYIFEKLESFSMLKQNVSVNEEIDLETVEPLWSSPLAEQMENCVLNCSQWKPYFISH